MPRGISKTPEITKEKMRKRMTGNSVALGYKHTKEAKENMSKRRLGQKHTLGLKHTIETKQRLSELNRGSKNHNWKGGISSENHRIRESLEYRLWRTAVFTRDNYTCIWCGAKNGNGKTVTLQADHIKPFAFFPELRFAIDNGRTLCKPCHQTTETYGFTKN